MHERVKFSSLLLCGQHSVKKHMAFMVLYGIHFHSLTIHNIIQQMNNITIYNLQLKH